MALRIPCSTTRQPAFSCRDDKRLAHAEGRRSDRREGAATMTTSRTRPLIDFLIWIPTAFYGVLLVQCLAAWPADGRTTLACLLTVLAFLLVGIANETQSRRIQQLQAMLNEQRRGQA